MDGKITALQVQKRNPNRVNVYLDGEFAFGLSRIVAAWLEVGQVLPAEKASRLREEDSAEVGLQRALHFLSFRPRSEKELVDHLRKHETSETAIENVLERLKRSEMVDDRRFAKTWIENRSDFRPRGARALRAELRQKGIADVIVAEALQNLDEEELAYQAGAARARKVKAIDERDFKKKMYGFLSRRGFGFDTIAGTVERLWAELSAAD